MKLPIDPLKHLYDEKCMDNVRDKYGSPYANKEGTLNGFIPVASPNEPGTIVILQCNYRIMWEIKHYGFSLPDDPERFMPSEEHCYGNTPFEALQRIVAWKGGDFIQNNYTRMKITWLDRYGKGCSCGMDELHAASCITVPIPLRTDDVPKDDFEKTIAMLKTISSDVDCCN